MSTLAIELERKLEEVGIREGDIMQRELASKSFDKNHVPKRGDIAIPFALPDEQGDEISLHSLLNEGPVILSFFRGEWCDFCQLELKALQRSAKDFHKFQATLIGVSPGTVTVQRVTKENVKLTYSLLVDTGNRVAEQYGLRYQLSEEFVSLLEGFGINLHDRHGGEEKEMESLPIPGTFVIDQKGVIVYAFADPDHSKRAEPSEIIASLMSIT